MMQVPEEHQIIEDPSREVSAGEGGRLGSILRRITLGFLALIAILSMLSNLIALPQTVNAPLQSDLGLTEADIVERYGPPDDRTRIQVVSSGDSIGLAPRRLNQGEHYFSFRYEEGPLSLVFHFVSPETYWKYNSYHVQGERWVVLERFIGTSNVIY